LETEVALDRFCYLTSEKAFPVPQFLFPPFIKNHGNYIASLGNLCRWLAGKAEEAGVEVYPGFAATEILYDEQGAVTGVVTGDAGVARDGSPKDTFMRGMELSAKYTLIGEGVHGSLAKQLIARFALDEGREPQKYGIGLKELWEVPAASHRPGLVQHTVGWPLDNRTGGGSFLYHFGENLVSVGFVVHLNYENPYLSPYDEFQRFKTHPVIREQLRGGRCIAYGARAITEGGWQSVPRLVFPGGALIGCSAGFVNVPKIKGTHNAIYSGMLAAEAAFAAIGAGRRGDELGSYQSAYLTSPIEKDLKRVRNAKPLWSRFGTLVGLALGGMDMWLNTLFPFLSHTLKHGKADHACLRPASEFRPIDYPKADGQLTFDKMTSVALSGTNHEEDQPVHLLLADKDLPLAINLPRFAEPAVRYCPAGVYEIVELADGKKTFQINAQNCVHCKTCDIKDPSQNITWVPPEGSGGPNYPNM
jgi:electron-transferring-flavoprotein dehydrogenase